MSNQLLKENYIRTSDLALTTCLCFFGYSIDEIDRNNPRKAQFLIKKDEKIDDYIKKFWRHELKVEPVAFFNLIKEIKSRLYDN
jgi:hypothetical protein